MEQATADLFPDAFQDSPLGPIPKGWWIKRLDEVADLNWGDTNKTKSSYIADGFTAYSASGADGFLPTFDFDRTGVVVSAIGANAGITWFASGKWSCIKNTLRFWATSPDISTEFLYFSTYGMDKWPQRGSAQSFISQGDARAIKIVIPGNALGCLFGEKAGPLLTCISDNEKRSRTLAGLRDTLLPKLLSGELSVDEAGRCVEQAV
jgi:type I restriction enzyme S subunit